MSRVAVDVVVVTFNTAEITVAALRHVLDSEQGVELRVIVHDNASADGTVAALQDQVPEADVVGGTENLGFAGGVNRALERSHAPFVLLLNSDAWPEESAVAALVGAALEHPTAAAVAPRLERPDGQLEHSTHPFPSLLIAGITAFGLQRLIGSRRAAALALEPAWAHDSARAVDWAVGAALLIRREALDSIGALDERFFMYAEDLEWCWRARRAGWSIWFEPAALVRHVGNASGEAAYGERRTEAYIHNTHRLYRELKGPMRARIYRELSYLGCRRNAVVAKIRGELGRAAYWRRVAAAHRHARRAHDRPNAPST